MQRMDTPKSAVKKAGAWVTEKERCGEVSWLAHQ